ncbi:protein of unknown function (plasmid) [Pararobbsia alpina]
MDKKCGRSRTDVRLEAFIYERAGDWCVDVKADAIIPVHRNFSTESFPQWTESVSKNCQGDQRVK